MQQQPRVHCDPVFLTLLYLLDYNCLKPVEEKQRVCDLKQQHRNLYTNQCNCFELMISSMHVDAVERISENGYLLCKNKFPMITVQGKQGVQLSVPLVFGTFHCT